eukprot:8981706-Pyramimonas_sp.AAC.1
MFASPTRFDANIPTIRRGRMCTCRCCEYWRGRYSSIQPQFNRGNARDAQISTDEPRTIQRESRDIS